ncbi:MAG: InlB B-repeat-containing protein [Clostridiales bacterium]|nr:MAG: InlB B-repeat-containing protein [Clostridiales bacterium]
MDNTNTKLYQCVSITTSETDGTKSYEWIKVIRENDYAYYSQLGVVRTNATFGINTSSYSVGSTLYHGALVIAKAPNSIIDGKANVYMPIVPANLDYAVRSVRPVTAATAPTTLAVNTLYSINNTSSASIAITLPQGQNGDFIQYDFVTGTTAPTVTIQSTYGSKLSNQTVTRNSVIKEPTTPTKDGFDFVGWYTDKELKTKYDFFLQR